MSVWPNAEDERTRAVLCVLGRTASSSSRRRAAGRVVASELGLRGAESREERRRRPWPTRAPHLHTSAGFLQQKLRSCSSSEVGWFAGLYLDDPQCRGLGGGTPPRLSQAAGTISASMAMTGLPRPGCA